MESTRNFVQGCAATLIAALAASVSLPYEAHATDAVHVHIDPYTMVGQPMGENELEDFARILILSEAQTVVLDSLYHDYVESMSQLVPRIQQLNRREIDRRSTGVVRQGEMVRAPTHSIHERFAEASEVLRESQRIESLFVAAENDFFLKLSALLAESQMERLHEAQRWRKRIRYQIRTEALPGAQVDLIDLVRLSGIEATDPEGMHEVMSAYEEKLVQLLHSRHRAQKRTHLRGLEWLARMDGVPIDPRALAERGRIRSQQIRLESSIRRLNLSTLEAISLMISESDFIKLYDEYHKVAHPMWAPYADAERVRRLLDKALHTEGLHEDIYHALAHLQESFNANYKRLQRRLSDADFNFRERLDRTLSAHVDDIADHEAEIEAILAERQSLSERTTQMVRELLNVEVR